MDYPVTVVIPCHNHARWVNEAIDSVLAQEGVAKRLVVVDDGSSDGSSLAVEARLENVQSSDDDSVPQVRLGDISGTRVMLASFAVAHGPSFARNYGIRAGWEGCEVFAFLDADDLYRPGKLSKSIALWSQSPEDVGAVYSDYETHNPGTGLRSRQYKEPFSRERLVRECLPNMDSLVSKLVFERCGVFDETLRVCEDYDLWLRISEQFIIMHVPEALLTLRVGGHSSTSTVPTAIWQACRRRVFEKAAQRHAGPVAAA